MAADINLVLVHPESGDTPEPKYQDDEISESPDSGQLKLVLNYGT